MKSNPNLKNCKGCTALIDYKGFEICCNMVSWTPAEVPENPPCMITEADEKQPGYVAWIGSNRAILKMMR